MSKPHHSESRRAFLRRASTLSIAGAAAPWALNLSAMADASAATASDYKAVVCVFLNGGNDYANTLVPYDTDSHAQYLALRPGLAFERARLDATALRPLEVPRDSAGFAHQYALAPDLAPLLPLFDAGKLAVLLNIGTLVGPTTKQQYTSKTAPLPPKLFSHNDQQSVWQSSMPEGAISGWGGRMGDLFESSNANATFTCINVSNNAVFLSGRSAVQYQVTPNGSVALAGLKNPLFGSSAASAALRTLMTQPRGHLLENEYNRIARRAIDANEVLAAALAAAPALATPFPSANGLADQLKLVARMIACAPKLGVKRQVFMVSMGGFDNHDSLLTAHPQLMGRLAGALTAFHQATTELGVADQVSAFTASDFGRTMTGNGNGSDHGWGSMHFVLGGAVRGQRYYGTAPIVANNGPDDVGQGRLLPTTSVEQLAATLGGWFGLSDSELLDMLPNLARYDAGVRTLGFL